MAEVKQPFNEEKLKDDVVKWVNDSKRFYFRRIAAVDEFVQRYEAKRSISGLMGWGSDPRANPKNSPWDNASDIGIPIEAFTIEGLLPRFLKVCYGAKPIVWIRGRTEADIERADTVQDAINFQLNKVIKIYRRMKVAFKNVTMSGDAIVKCVWEVNKKTVNRIVYYAIDSLTGQPLVHQPVEGQEPTGLEGTPIEFKKDEELPPINEATGGTLLKHKQILSEEKKIYDSPKIYSRNIKQIVIPKDADSPDIEELDWICDQYERTIDWLKRRVGDIEDGLFNERAVRELEENLVSTAPAGSVNPNFNKILISEWHGRYRVDASGLESEIVVFIGTKDLTANIDNTVAIQNSKLLGWMITPYPRRPFFHYQIIPMDGSFYGKGVPEFLIGIRNLIDAIFNQAIDRGSINNNPPLITPTNHDPDESPFGPGVSWPSDTPNAYRVLELPKSEQMEFIKIEFLLSLVQKLFGVTDYSLGTESSIASNRTATGIMTIVGEGNIKFDDMIRALQDINEDLYDFIVQLNAEFLEDDIVFRLTGKENPFINVGKGEFVGNFDYEAAGNSININRQIEQERASAAYRLGMESFGKNPVITAEVMRTLTQNFFDGIDMRNVKLPTLQEVQQKRIEDTAEAIKLIQQQEAEAVAKLQKQGGQPGGQAQTPNLGQAIG